jgi:DNA-directed RNA polymerase specialized sigma24 family protein
VPRYAPTPRDPTGTFADWELHAVAAEVDAFLATHPSLRVEAEEIVWECLQHWHRRRVRYAKSRGARERTFLNRVVGNKLLDILDRSLSGKEQLNRHASSIDVPVRDVEDLTLADLLADEDPHGAPEGAALAAEVRWAVDRATAQLTERDRDVIERLRRGDRVSEISRETGRSRGAVYGDIDRIRLVFEDEGLAAFLD